MMLSSGFHKFWWTVLAGLLLIGAILIGKTVLAKPAIITADAAVNLALSYGNIQYLSGMGQPTLWNIWEGDEVWRSCAV